jgi:hypothetical protein
MNLSVLKLPESTGNFRYFSQLSQFKLFQEYVIFLMYLGCILAQCLLCAYIQVIERCKSLPFSHSLLL